MFLKEEENIKLKKKLIKAIENEKDLDIKSFIIIKDNEIISKYIKMPYLFKNKHILFSMTKSFSSLAIGLLQDKGLLNITDKVIDYFKDKMPTCISENLAKMEIKDLLTMSSGVHENTYESILRQEDWIKAFLEKEFKHKPGTYYKYNTHGSHILSAIVERVAGINLMEFMIENLFNPLEIYNAEWEYARDGYIAGGMGLSLDIESVAKVGYMLLNNGVYLGKRIISSEYINQATTNKIYKHSEEDRLDRIYSGMNYGYQFHTGKDNCFRMDGAFGQICLINKEKNMLVVVNSLNSKVEKLLKVIYNNVFNYSLNNILDSNEKDNRANLKEDNYKIPFEGEFIFTECKNNIDNIKILINKKKVTILTTKNNSSNQKLEAYFTKENYGESIFIKDLNEISQTYWSKIFIEENIIRVEVRYLETPYVCNYLIEKNEKYCKLEFIINTSFTIESYKTSGKILKF